MRREMTSPTGGDRKVVACEVVVAPGDANGVYGAASSPNARLIAGTIDTRVRAMTRAELVLIWQRRWRRSPPKGLSRRLLEGNTAWLLQAEASGGLTAATRRRLDALARPRRNDSNNALQVGQPNTVNPKAARHRLRPGTRLIRQWHGRSYVVEVIEGSFVYEGQKYTSLTSIACAITGTRWSGPRFFGLNASTAGASPKRHGRKAPPKDRHTDIRVTHEEREDE